MVINSQSANNWIKTKTRSSSHLQDFTFTAYVIDSSDFAPFQFIVLQRFEYCWRGWLEKLIILMNSELCCEVSVKSKGWDTSRCRSQKRKRTIKRMNRFMACYRVKMQYILSEMKSNHHQQQLAFANSNSGELRRNDVMSANWQD